jgi:ABC-type lipoprotein release transport system permease subunit
MVLTTIGYDSKKRVEEFRVSDIAVTQNFFGDKSLYMPIEEFRRIRFGEQEASRPCFIKVKVKRGVNPRSVVPAIERSWQHFAAEHMKLAAEDIPRLSVHTSQDWYADVFADLQNQMRVVLLIFAVICSVAVLLIFCIFYMIVTTRQKDIAIIKSCGASSTAAASIFAGFGICAGIAGGAMGVVAGTVITRNINIVEGWVRIVFGIKLWRTSSYGLATIPHQVNWPAVPWIAGAAAIGCLAGVLIPAIIAARTKPVQILRYE